MNRTSFQTSRACKMVQVYSLPARRSIVLAGAVILLAFASASHVLAQAEPSFAVYAIYLADDGEKRTVRPENLPRDTRSQAALEELASQCEANVRCMPNPLMCEVIQRRRETDRISNEQIQSLERENEPVPTSNFYPITSIRYYGYVFPDPDNILPLGPASSVTSDSKAADATILRSYMCTADEVNIWRYSLAKSNSGQLMQASLDGKAMTVAATYPLWCYVRAGGRTYIHPNCTR